MKKTAYRIWSKFLTAFGNVKCFRFPLWLVYDPDDYQISGENVLEILDVLKPGDIILRGYDKYLDGKFIPNFKNDVIGVGFSHGAVYLGDNTILHAVAEGVSEINVVDFCQCDRIAIFRPRKGGTKKAIANVKKCIGKKYDFIFQENNNNVYCFELCKIAYPNSDIKTMTIKRFFGLFRKKVYVAQSIIEAKDFRLIYCINRKSGIFFKKNRICKTYQIRHLKRH